MGNSPSGPRLLGNGKYSSYHINLDNAATITVTKHQEKTQDQEKSKKSQKWELKYDVDGMTCTVSIFRTRRNSDDENLCVIVADDYDATGGFHPTVKFLVTTKKNSSGLHCTSYEGQDTLSNQKRTKLGISRSGEVVTYYWAYGLGTRMGFLVVVKKKKINEELPYMVTVAHYYVNSGSGGNFGASGVDIGFSVVVKIGVSHNGQLDFSVDGPVEHPSSALLFMIEEVFRTGTWKLSSCPHCKNIQCQRRWLSESEDSDTPSSTTITTLWRLTKRSKYGTVQWEW